MLIVGQEFDAVTGPPRKWTDVIFNSSAFRDLEISGAGIDEALVYCTLENVDWYWGLFNTALVAQTDFRRCVFRGCSFRSVDFIACRFENCRFVNDNLGGVCVVDDCRLVECVFDGCEVMPETRAGREPVFTKTRFYGCAQTHSRGLEGQF